MIENSNPAKSLLDTFCFVLFSFKNACAKKPCHNNAVCQAGFTDRDYQCLCIPGFTGYDCENGRKNTLTPLKLGGDGEERGKGRVRGG